jgi:hypothetical protein
MGLVRLFSKEMNESIWVDTSSKQTRDDYKRHALKRLDKMEQALRRSGVDFARISTNQDYVKPLLGLFKAREARR